jgi:5-methylcytosine-specific restriction protein A
MARDEFSKRTKLEAFAKCGGKCECCGALLTPGRFHYDHWNPDYFGGPANDSNICLLCIGCHHTKTSSRDIPTIAKSRRIRAKEAGIKKQSKFACSRNGKWKKKVSGEVVPR